MSEVLKEIGGYPDNIFTCHVEDYLRCDTCQKVLKDPVRVCTISDHYFCRSCLPYANNNDLFQKETRPNNCIFPARHINAAILNLPVKCSTVFTGIKIGLNNKCIVDSGSSIKSDKRKYDIDHSNTCEWQGKLRDIESHMDLCSFMESKCSYNGCNYRNQKRHLSAHENKCPHRNLTCRYCFDEEKFSFLRAHEYFFCPKRPIPCGNEYCCEIIPLNLMSNHKSVCLFEVVDCPEFNKFQVPLSPKCFRRSTRGEMFENNCTDGTTTKATTES